MAIDNPMLVIRRELAVKIETTKGTQLDPDLTGLDSKFLIMEPKLITEFGVFERNFSRKSISRIKHLIVDRPARIQFKLEMRRTNTADTADVWMTLLELCGFKKTTSPATSVTYTPDSDFPDMSTGTMWLFNEGFRCGIKGAMGEVSLVGETGKPMMLEFDFLGRFLSPVDDTLNTVTHESALSVPFQGVDFKYGGSSDHVITSFKLKMNNRVVLRKSVNDAGAILHAMITGRDPSLELDPETRDDFGYFTNLVNNTEVAIAVEPLGDAGPATLTLPKCQEKTVEEGDRDGILTSPLVLGVNANAAAGDDEMTLVFT